MANNVYLKILSDCLSFIDQNLADEEAILDIELGQTRYGHVVTEFFKVEIGTFKGKTGWTPTDIRYRIVAVTSNPTDNAYFAQWDDWRPLDRSTIKPLPEVIE